MRSLVPSLVRRLATPPALVVAATLLAAVVGCRQMQPADLVSDVEQIPGIDAPSASVAVSRSYGPLFDACQQSLQRHGFRVDRLDYRHGQIVCEPLVSAQPLELWRGDVVTERDAWISALGTVRRRAAFSIDQQPDGSYQARPKVVVERLSSRERRVTSGQQWRSAFSAAPSVGTRETDAGQAVPDEYWYPMSRDPALEQALAEDTGRLTLTDALAPLTAR